MRDYVISFYGTQSSVIRNMQWDLQIQYCYFVHIVKQMYYYQEEQQANLHYSLSEHHFM